MSPLSDSEFHSSKFNTTLSGAVYHGWIAANAQCGTQMGRVVGSRPVFGMRSATNGRPVRHENGEMRRSKNGVTSRREYSIPVPCWLSFITYSFRGICLPVRVPRILCRSGCSISRPFRPWSRSSRRLRVSCKRAELLIIVVAWSLQFLLASHS